MCALRFTIYFTDLLLDKEVNEAKILTFKNKWFRFWIFVSSLVYMYFSHFRNESDNEFLSILNGERQKNKNQKL